MLNTLKINAQKSDIMKIDAQNRDDALKTEYDREKRKIIPWFLPLAPLITYKGLENVIEDKPSIIIANHPGVSKDVAALLMAYDRQIYFTASDFLFDKESLVDKSKNKYPKLYRSFTRIADYMCGFVSDRVHKYEMIPVGWEYTGDLKGMTGPLRKSTDKVKDYLKDGRTVVLFQLRTDIIKQPNHDSKGCHKYSEYHSYLPRFHNTVPRIAYELYLEGYSIPITTVAIHGSEGLNPLKPMIVSIGEPLHIEEMIKSINPANPITSSSNPIVDAKNILEQRVAQQLVDAGIPRNINTRNIYK